MSAAAAAAAAVAAPSAFQANTIKPAAAASDPAVR